MNRKVIAIWEDEDGEALDVAVADSFDGLSDAILAWTEKDWLRSPNDTIKIYYATHTMTVDMDKSKASREA